MIISLLPGHGVHIANMELNMANYSKHYEGTTSHTNYQAQSDAPRGDCLVSVTGKYCPTEGLKRKVLEVLSDRWTLTLDMCRGLSTRGPMKERIHFEIP